MSRPTETVRPARRRASATVMASPGGPSRPLSAREHETIVALERTLDRVPSLRAGPRRWGPRALGVLGLAAVVVVVLVGAGALLGVAGFELGAFALGAVLLGVVLHDLWRSHTR